MNTAKNICFWMTFGFIFMTAFNAHAATAYYTLDNVILAGGEQITGRFDWTFSAGDFAGGSGAFTSLEIPYTIYSFADGNLNTDIQTNSIEITGNGNYHDTGLDITLFLPQPFTLTQSAPIDAGLLGLSFFECCGNGFLNQHFLSGSISPTFAPADTDVDGDVDTADLTTMNQNFTGAVGGAGGKTMADGDTDMDGDVDTADLTLGFQQFTGAQAVSVPEPGSLALFAFGLLGLFCVARRCYARRQ